MIKQKISKTVLGIDPGYDRVGWSIGFSKSAKFDLLALGCIQTNKKDTIFDRYKQIQLELDIVIKKFNPTELAIETLFFSKNKKTALRVSEARGVIIATCLENNLSIYEYSPNAIKLAVTGSGAANKQAVEKMVKMQTKVDLKDQIDDAIDAVAIGMTHSFTHNY